MKRWIIGFAILWTLFVLVVARSDWAYKPIPALTRCDFLGHDFKTVLCWDGAGKRVEVVRCSRRGCFVKPPLAPPWRCPGVWARRIWKVGEMKKVPCEIYSRVVGFFRPVQNWNIGKRAEYADRKNYDPTKSLKSLPPASAEVEDMQRTLIEEGGVIERRWETDRVQKSAGAA